MKFPCYLREYFPVWLLLFLVGLYCRPLTPVDETRAVSVAWEMWQRSDFLVPYLNGQPYSHKPPLLQWCIHLSWLMFGVEEWGARIVAPLFALGNLALTVKLARRLWGDDKTSCRLAPWLLLAVPAWALWTSLTLYDMLATFFTVMGLLGTHRAAQGANIGGWALTGLAIGGGILSKGPVVLIMILPTAMLAPLWLQSPPNGGWRRWYLGLAAGLIVGAAIGLAWALPAGLAGGEEYRRLIFWGQSAGRIGNSFAHKRPSWWYVSLLPIILLPWSIWPPMWRSLWKRDLDTGQRFCAVQSLTGILALSLISGKQIHYLLPTFPAMALIAARALSRTSPAIARSDQMPLGLFLSILGGLLLFSPSSFKFFSPKAAEIAHNAPLLSKLIFLGLGVAILSWRPEKISALIVTLSMALATVMLSAHLIYRESIRPYFDIQAFADRLARVEQENAPIAHWRKYHGEFNFLGRLRQPLLEFNIEQNLIDWMKAHPKGYVVLVSKTTAAHDDSRAEFTQGYRGGRQLMLWNSEKLLAQTGFIH